MDFYLIPAAGSEPAKLEATQPEARATCKARGLRFKAQEMAHAVPTTKRELQGYINDLLGRSSSAQAPIASEPELEPAAEQRLAEPAPGFMSQAEVDRLFEPRAENGQRVPRLWSAGDDNDAICLAIEEMNGQQLGNVAGSVAHRFEQLAKLAPGLAG